jgi:hypothetical protein
MICLSRFCADIINFTPLAYNLNKIMYVLLRVVVVVNRDTRQEHNQKISEKRKPVKLKNERHSRKKKVFLTTTTTIISFCLHSMKIPLIISFLLIQREKNI